MPSPAACSESFAAKLRGVQTSLQGSKIHDVPITSTETLVGALRKHNALLATTRGDVKHLTCELETVASSVRSLQTTCSDMQRTLRLHALSTSAAYARINKLDALVKGILSKVDRVDAMEETLSSQGSELNEVKRSLEKTNQDLSGRLTAVENGEQDILVRLAALGTTVGHMETRLKALPTELRLPSDNIDYGSRAKPEDVTSLSVVLRHVYCCIQTQDAAVGHVHEMLRAYDELLGGKASIAVESEIDKHATILRYIYDQLKKHPSLEASAMDDFKRQSEEALSALSLEMKNKVSPEDLELKVDERYGEILKYLQSTLQVAETDPPSTKPARGITFAH